MADYGSGYYSMPCLEKTEYKINIPGVAITVKLTCGVHLKEPNEPHVHKMDFKYGSANGMLEFEWEEHGELFSAEEVEI